MVLHVLFAAGTFIFSKAAAVSFADPMVLTLCRGGGGRIDFFAVYPDDSKTKIYPWRMGTAFGVRGTVGSVESILFFKGA